MSRWAKSGEELKWRVIISMCWHKMARLRPFPLNADASGRAHRLNWWCTTSWMRGNKSTSRLLVSLLLAPGNCGQFNWKQLGRIQRASRYLKIQVNLKQVYFCSLQRSSQDFWWLIENLQLHWKLTETYMRRWLWIWEACSLNLLIIFILLLLTGSWDVAPAIQVLWTEAWIHRL